MNRQPREHDFELQMPSKVSRIKAHYERRIEPDRESYDVLDWGTRESQLARFRALLGVLQRPPVPSGPPSFRG